MAMKIGFLGGGTMAKALARCFITTKTVEAGNIIASATTQKTVAFWKDLGCQATLVNKEVVEYSDVVFLAVKPHLVVPVIQEIKSSIDSCRHLLVTLAAAITVDVIESHLPPSTRVVRVQPNLACSVQSGVNAISEGTCVREDDVPLVKKLLQTSGMCVEIKESYMNSLAAVSGSGLAYMGLAMEAMSDGGVKVGLPRALAMDLATQTLIGAARLVQEGGKHPGQIKDEVCSPGGTTICGIHTLEKAGFRSSLIDAVEIAAKRATEIAELQKSQGK
ncbi:hypothetical protein ACROYT_G020875 [Oculina patagonica]